MASLCLPVISFSPPLQHHQVHLPSQKTHFPIPILPSKLTSCTIQSVNFHRKTSQLRSKFNDSVEPSFKNDNGVGDDMEDYLNTLSLEYDSVWDTKPYWCQPWTIVLTGVSITVCSWLILHSVIVTGLASSLICAWWFVFLYSYPKAYTEMIAERRKKVRSGTEDTYGWTKSQ